MSDENSPLKMLEISRQSLIMLVNKEDVGSVIVLHLAASKNRCFVSKPFTVKVFKPMSLPYSHMLHIL